MVRKVFGSLQLSPLITTGTISYPFKGFECREEHGRELLRDTRAVNRSRQVSCWARRNSVGGSQERSRTRRESAGLAWSPVLIFRHNTE